MDFCDWSSKLHTDPCLTLMRNGYNVVVSGAEWSSGSSSGS
jgi:hypothetical protein